MGALGVGRHEACPYWVIELRKVGKQEAQRLQCERRLRFCDLEVAKVNSSLELTVGSSSNEKISVGTALTLTARFNA